MTFIPAAWSVAGLQAIPTAGSLLLNTLIPVMNIEAAGVLSWYLLEAGNTGIIPNDANATTNNVSWHQVL